MRRLWQQREVIEIANLLGFKNFNRNSLAHWTRMGVFPEPKAQLPRESIYYDNDRVDVAFVDISKRLRKPIPITYDDVAWAKSKVLETNRAKAVSLFIRKMREKEIK